MELNSLGVLSSLELSEVGITDGLVLWYPLNGDANDYSGSGNHGTVYGPIVTSGLNGKLLYSFDKTDDYIDLGDVPLSQSTTLSFWVNPSTTNSGQCFFGKNSLTGGNILLFGYWNNGYHFSNGTGSQVAVGDLHSGVWDHLVFVAENGSSSTLFSVYRNGVHLGSTTVAGLVSMAEGKTQLGMEYDSATKTDYYGGLMSDVRIYDRLLSLLEIKILYDLGLGSTKMITTESNLYISGILDEVTM